MESSYGQEGSWTADETAGSYTGDITVKFKAVVYAAANVLKGFEQQQLNAPSFQTSIMSNQGIAAYTTQPQQPVYRHYRQPQPKKEPSQPQIFYCEICRVSCAGPQPYADHLNGQKHKKKEAAHGLQQKLEQCPKPAKAVASTTSRLYCELCDVACGSADTFGAHIRGVKHLRVLNLHTMMGKPVPNVTMPQASQTASAPASTALSTLASTSTYSAPASASISTPGIKPEAKKTNLSATAVSTDATEKAGGEAAMDTSEIVGQEFIEEVRNEKGLVVSYSCKLCECSFTDPNARRVHLNGRRHRLQYKRKIDSTIEVEVRMNLRMQKLREERNKKLQAKESYWRQQDQLLGMRMEQNQPDFEMWNRPRYAMGPRYNTPDDRYMIKKHMDLYPPKEEMAEVHSAIVQFENALKLVSDAIAAEDEPAKKIDSAETSEVTTKNVESEKMGVAPAGKMTLEEPSQDEEKEAIETTATEAADCEASRRIKGAMRVGLLSRGVLLRDDLAEHLVIICSEKPTRSLLQRIVDHLPAQLEVISPLKKFKIEMRPEEAGLFVTIEEPTASFAVTLTSMSVGEEQEQVNPQAEDQLSPAHCLLALALLRHTKWFQVRLCAMKAGTVVTHVLRDFCRRTPIWKPLSEWAQELLVEKCIFAAGIDIGPGEALRSFFECISSGILLPGGHGLMDPCEKVQTDVTAELTAEQSEAITASAQRCLRLVVYRQIYKILDVPRFKRPSYKRRRDHDDNPETVQDDKKLKEEGALQGNGATSEHPLTSIDKNATEDP